MERTPSPPIILDCTIRDGNYAVEFKFNEADTALLSKHLSRLGFRWIEVGHGLGLGAMEAGKGDMTAGDAQLIRAAKQYCGDAKIGAFFIPGIGKPEHLEMAVEAGLDFVRVGSNAPELPQAYPYITMASKMGLTTCVNLMKSYAVSPEEFAELSAGAQEAGAEVIFCVDSAGSMLPRDVRAYMQALRKAVDCEMGFHGHNNLMMAIENCVVAYEEGARYLDATLCGLGRSAGNAPTEILLAVLDRLGVDTGIDLYEVMDLVQTYMWPMVSRTRAHDMMGVACGYSQFHSSFLPAVSAAARRHKVELRRLVVQVAQHNSAELDEEFMEECARRLAGTDTVRSSQRLVSFWSPGEGPTRISTSLEAVRRMVLSLEATCAKASGSRPVVLLKIAPEQMQGMVVPQFMLQDSAMALASVTCDSVETLRQVVEATRDKVFVYLVDLGQAGGGGALEAVAELVGQSHALPVRDQDLKVQYLRELLDRVALKSGRGALLVFGADPLINQGLADGGLFGSMMYFGQGPGGSRQAGGPEAVVLPGKGDWRNLTLGFDVILCGSEPSLEDARDLWRALRPGGVVVSLYESAVLNLLEQEGLNHLAQDLNQAYAGILPRLLSGRLE